MTAVDTLRVDFLRDLTARTDSFLVWKHLQRALRGRGDIDAAAARSVIPAIAAHSLAIGRDVLHADLVIRCEHVPDRYLQFFVQQERLPQLFELDICLQPSRGSAPWAEPTSLVAVSTVGPEGIRSLRPGADALVSLVLHGLSARGHDGLAGDEQVIVTDGLETDLPGALKAAELLPPPEARRSVRALVDCVVAGGWDERLARRAFLGFVQSSVRSPGFVARRLAFRAALATHRICPMVELARYHDRKVRAERLPELVDRARATGHEVCTL